MMNHALKAGFFHSMTVPMRVSGWLYRNFRAPTSGTIKVHLGPGQQKYLPGWYNVDGNFISAKFDIWADLRSVLPFKDNTVDAIYSHHVIEHLPQEIVQPHFRE